MRGLLAISLSAIIYVSEIHARHLVKSTALITISSTSLTISASRNPTTNHISNKHHNHFDRRRRLAKTGGTSKSKSGGSGSGVSKNTNKKEVKKSQKGYSIAGPVAALALFWYFRSSPNFDDTNAQCFTQDAFEKALQKNITQNTSLGNETGSDINTSDDSAEVIYIETTIGKPINLNHLSDKQIIDIKEAFNTTTGQENYEPELCPSVSAAFSSKGVFVQVANIATIALKQLFSFF